MNIHFNSKTYFIDSILPNQVNKINIYQLLSYLGYEIQTIVVEYNGFIVETSSLKKIFLKDQDKIEAVSIVGGG